MRLDGRLAHHKLAGHLGAGPAAGEQQQDVALTRSQRGQPAGGGQRLGRAGGERLDQAAIYRNGLGVSDDEEGAVIYVATGLRASWSTAWPSFRDFS